MSQKQCPCPEAKAGECCLHCPVRLMDSECQPVHPSEAAFLFAPAPVESPLYAVEAGDEVRPIMNGSC